MIELENELDAVMMAPAEVAELFNTEDIVCLDFKLLVLLLGRQDVRDYLVTSSDYAAVFTAEVPTLRRAARKAGYELEMRARTRAPRVSLFTSWRQV
jgi:hypothetical protein